MKHQTRKFLDNSGFAILGSSTRIARETLKLLDNSVVELFNDRALFGSPAETLRVLSSWSPKTESDRVARSLVLLAAYRAEQSSPCSSYLFLRLLSGEILPDCSPRLMLESDLVGLLRLIADLTVESLLSSSIKEAGASGNINVSTGAITHISVDEFASFPVIVSPSFTNACSLTSRKIVAYDGVVESVGQINEFLVKCAEENASVMFLARAFSQDVASTIYANNQRKVFDIVPATPNVAVNDEFTLADVSSIVGQRAEVEVKLKDTAHHEMMIENGFLKLRLRDASQRDKLVGRLREELRQFNNSDITKLLSERIRKVSSRRVLVCIGEEFGSSKEITKEKFDHGMRSYISSRRKGIINISGETLPGDSLRVARSSYEAFEKLVRNVGGVLVIDKNLEMAKRRPRKARRD